MFERIRRSLERAWLVPLLDGGRSVVYVVGIEELSSIIRDVVLNDSPDMRGSVWNVQQPDSHTLRQLMEEIRRVFGYRCRFVPIPSLPVLWGVMAAEAVPGLRLPISSTNIRGLRQSRHETHRSDFARFGYPERSLEELIEGVKQFTG